MKKFDPAIPRQMFWSDSVRDKFHCPECHCELEKESHAYVMVVRDAHGIHPFIVGNDAGHFCAACPTVVLDKETFREMALIAFGSAAQAQFTVLGIVNLAAVPEEMQSRALGEDGNPVPLVEFIRKPVAVRKRQGKAKAAKKRRRGKKHKSG